MCAIKTHCKYNPNVEIMLFATYCSALNTTLMLLTVQIFANSVIHFSETVITFATVVNPQH